MPQKNTLTLGKKKQKTFNSIGIGFKYHPLKNWFLIGSTAWAYQGDHGAYDEGWFGFGYRKNISEKIALELNSLIGAGGGGGIDVGSGLLFLIGSNFLIKLKEDWSIYLAASKFIPKEGRFSPLLIDIGIQLDLNLLLRQK